MPSDRPAIDKQEKYYLYAIRLHDDVLTKRKFVSANPKYKLGKPCFYIGTSIYPPKKRFQQHLDGEHSSKWVREFGQHVAKRKCKVRLKSVHGAREEVERAYAEELRSQGYGIWQN